MPSEPSEGHYIAIPIKFVLAEEQVRAFPFDHHVAIPKDALTELESAAVIASKYAAAFHASQTTDKDAQELLWAKIRSLTAEMDKIKSPFWDSFLRSKANASAGVVPEQ